MTNPIVPIAVAISLLTLAACDLSPKVKKVAGERLFVTALNAVFRVASSDLLPRPPIEPRSQVRPVKRKPAVCKVEEKICASGEDEPLVLRHSRKHSRVVTF